MRLDQRHRRPPAKTPAGCAVGQRGVGAAHAPHVEVEHAAEVPLGVVRRQPPAQVAVQHHRVEQRLERVVRVQHRLGQPGRGVVGGASARCRAPRAGWSCSRRRRSGPPRRPPWACAAPRRSSRRGSRAAAGRRAAAASSRAAYGASGSSAARCARSSGARSRRCTSSPRSRTSPPASGNSKSSSRSRSRSGTRPSVCPGTSGPSGVSCSGTSAAASWSAVDVGRPPAQLLGDPVAQLGAAGRAPPGRRAPARRAPGSRTRRRRAGPPSARPGRVLAPRGGCGRRRRPRHRLLVLEAGGLGLAGDRDRLLHPDQARVGGAPPVGVDPPAELPDRERRAGRRRGRGRGVRDDRHLDHRAAELLDPPQHVRGVRVVAHRLPVGHHRVAGATAEEHPVQAAVAGARRGRPPRDDL